MWQASALWRYKRFCHRHIVLLPRRLFSSCQQKAPLCGKLSRYCRSELGLTSRMVCIRVMLVSWSNPMQLVPPWLSLLARAPMICLSNPVRGLSSLVSWLHSQGLLWTQSCLPLEWTSASHVVVANSSIDSFI